jgi:Methyltransferase domain
MPSVHGESAAPGSSMSDAAAARCGRAFSAQFSSYCGIDAVRYHGFPSSGEFRQADLDRWDWSVDPNVADLVVSLATIEHVENPWAFMRGLARIVNPGAWLAVTTLNQLSWSSLATLIVRHRFSAFPDA